LAPKREAIKIAEDRMLFKQAMDEAGLQMPRGWLCESCPRRSKFVEDTGYPAIIRPSFTLGWHRRRHGLQPGRV